MSYRTLMAVQGAHGRFTLPAVTASKNSESLALYNKSRIAPRVNRAFAGTPVGVAEFDRGKFARALASGAFARALLLHRETLLIGTLEQGVVSVPLRTQAVCGSPFCDPRLPCWPTAMFPRWQPMPPEGCGRLLRSGAGCDRSRPNPRHSYRERCAVLCMAAERISLLRD